MKLRARKIRLRDFTAHDLKTVMVGKEQQVSNNLFALPDPESVSLGEIKGNKQTNKTVVAEIH